MNYSSLSVGEGAVGEYVPYSCLHLSMLQAPCFWVGNAGCVWGCVWEAVMAVLIRPSSVISMSFCGELLLVLVLQELGVCSEGALNFVYSKTINSFDILFFTRLLWLWLFLMSHEMAIGNPLILLPTRVCNFRSNHFVADVNFVMRNTRFMTAGFLTDCFIA